MRRRCRRMRGILDRSGEATRRRARPFADTCQDNEEAEREEPDTITSNLTRQIDNSFTNKSGKTNPANMSSGFVQRNDRKCGKGPWLVVAQLEHRPPTLNANQQQQPHQRLLASKCEYRVRDSEFPEPFRICVTARPRMTEIRTERSTELVHRPNCRAYCQTPNS